MYTVHIVYTLYIVQDRGLEGVGWPDPELCCQEEGWVWSGGSSLAHCCAIFQLIRSFRWSQPMNSGGTERQWRDIPGGLIGCCWANFDNVFGKTIWLQRQLHWQLQNRQHRQIHYWPNLRFFRQRGRCLALVPPSAQLCASASNQVDGHDHDDDVDGDNASDYGDDGCVVVAELCTSASDQATISWPLSGKSNKKNH